MKRSNQLHCRENVQVILGIQSYNYNDDSFKVESDVWLGIDATFKNNVWFGFDAMCC